MRALIASTEGAGHFGPLVAVIEALRRRGEEVLIVGPPGLTAAAKETDCPFEAGTEARSEELTETWRLAASASPQEAAVLVNREIFGRLNTAAMLPTLERVCAHWRPDLILREPCEYASAIVAERTGVPHAQVAISLASVEEGSLGLAAPVLEPYLHGIVERLRAAPYLTRFPGSLDPSHFPNTIRFHERGHEPSRALPRWWGADDRPLVYATLGSLAGRRPIARDAYRTLLDALAPLPMRVLLTTGNHFDRAWLAALPPHIHVEPWVAQRDVLPHATLVVCHGGSGTTFGALAAGVPLVILPLFADQPVNAKLVVAAGAGVAVASDEGRSTASTSRSSRSASSLHEAIQAVLADPQYRRAAADVAREMHATPAIEDVLSTLVSPVGGPVLDI
jgi:UDP:flavonoid glycosyltransferase YjiC (YdhE family)